MTGPYFWVINVRGELLGLVKISVPTEWLRRGHVAFATSRIERTLGRDEERWSKVELRIDYWGHRGEVWPVLMATPEQEAVLPTLREWR